MPLKTRKLLVIITIISLLLIGEGLAANAMNNQIEDEATPDLFHIGTFNLKINVSKTEFTPATFTVKESATVNLTIESIDIGHTFEIPEYGIDEEIEANTTINIEFVADKYGTFTYSSVNCTASGEMIVLNPYVPDMPRPEDIDILFDYKHNTNNTEIDVKYSTIINWIKDSKFNLDLNNNSFLIDTIINPYDLVIILQPDIAFENTELEALVEFTMNGGGLLIGGSPETADINTFEIVKPFGFSLTNATARAINSTDLIDPIGENNTLASFFLSEFLDHPIINENQYVPLTDDIVTKMNFLGNILEYNETWIIDELNASDLLESNYAIDSYGIVQGNETIFADVNDDGIVDENETIGIENYLIGASETQDNGRLICFGSADNINNTQVGRYDGNYLFFQRALQWIVKMYATIENTNYQLDTFEVRKGTAVHANASFYGVNNTSLDSLNVTLRVWRISGIEHTFAVIVENETHYQSTIDTDHITVGTVYINFQAHQRGYGYNTTRDFYVVVNPAAPVGLDIPIVYLITYIASIVIGIVALTFFFVRVMKTPKITQVSEVVEELEEAETEEVNLDEYET
ncbi:MAG: cupredoxin domain-containing protein [Candidatus Thorarchaeota archaeon]